MLALLLMLFLQARKARLLEKQAAYREAELAGAGQPAIPAGQSLSANIVIIYYSII